MALAEQLKLYREKSGLSQASVAEELKISRQSISKWENGRGYPDIDNLVLLSKLYQVSIDELLQENEQLKEQIQKNNVEIEDKKKKLSFITQQMSSDKDEGLILLLLAGVSSRHPPKRFCHLAQQEDKFFLSTCLYCLCNRFAVKSL